MWHQGVEISQTQVVSREKTIRTSRDTSADQKFCAFNKKDSLDMAKELKEGLKAPAFSLPTDGGGKIRLADLQGQNVVLYFYPKDMTPGCTTEAIDFSGHAAAFKKTNTLVIGVSKDSVERHDKFKAKHDLTITLASDESGAMLEKYGVWQEKKLYGKVFMGIVRSTILIDAEGKIARIWPKVRVKGHADEVLEAAQAL